MTVLTPASSKNDLNISNSGAVGRPSQSTIAITGVAPRSHCRNARSMADSWRRLVGRKLPRNSLRNAFITGRRTKTAARLSLYAIPAGDSALYSTKRTSSAKKLSRRTDEDDDLNPGSAIARRSSSGSRASSRRRSSSFSTAFSSAASAL